MLLGFKTELNLNNQQRTALAQHAGTARHAWNWGLWLTEQILKHNQAHPTEKLKFPSAIDLHKLLVAIVKPENPWYYKSSKCAPQYALRQLREAWDRAFKKTAKTPQFKRKGKSQDSFTLDGAIKILGVHHIQVPVIGVLKTFESLPQVQVKNVTISRQSDKWSISFKIEVDPQPTEKTNLVENARCPDMYMSGYFWVGFSERLTTGLPLLPTQFGAANSKTEYFSPVAKSLNFEALGRL